MRAPISIVIPTLNSARDLPVTLLSLMEGLDANLIYEVVISDGGSTDETKEIASEWGAAWLEGPSSRGGQLKRGVAHARGSWIFVLHADTFLQEGWSEDVASYFHEGPLCFSLAFRADGLAPRLVECWANLRTSVLGLPFGDQGLILSRNDYDRAGGYPDQPLMEDVALVLALTAKIRRLSSRAFTDAEKYKADGWVRRGAQNILILLRYFGGASAEALSREYQSSVDPN